ncbi:CLUMA_CG010852, isoform A [Clunio marinus]|uniref:CLUMA_CG010852, isoform A n=1 Tax=Clunio marinus TaxID=568069 RepID=A0A1J1IB00_9DIPT|nr:CLUMA_CG010852, isoform A [Clunio marinus]
MKDEQLLNCSISVISYALFSFYIVLNNNVNVMMVKLITQHECLMSIFNLIQHSSTSPITSSAC